MEKKGKEAKAKVLWKLFISTLYLSAFTFGGGYVIVTLMKKKFVDDLHWIDEKEMLDLVAIAQSSPGAIAVNGAIVVGYKLAGIAGVLVSILGTMLPPFVIISVISAFYQAFRSNFFISQMLEGMQAGVGAVIASVTYEMGAGIVKEKDAVSVGIMIGAFIVSCIFGVNVVLIILVCGLLGGTVQLWWRLCRYAADSGTGCYNAPVAEHVGVYGSDHNFADDTGTDCGQFGNFCRN